MSDRHADGTAPLHPGDLGLARLKDVLNGWRGSLLDMGGRNRLLNFRHTRTATLEITEPGVEAVLAGLAKGWDFAPVAEADQDADTPPASGTSLVNASSVTGRRSGMASGLVTQKTRQAALDTALHQLRRKSAQMYNDYGLWVLWLGVGMLNWREGGAEETSAAPLLLVPVELTVMPDRRTRLCASADQELLHNVALAAKMERLGLDWMPVTGVDVSEPAGIVAAARRIAATQDRWSVEDRLVIGLFSSYKEAMYQDLYQNEDRILAHSLVRAVALGPDSGLPHDAIAFDPPALERIDEVQLPERTPIVLDADASQRSCIAAALDGRSFVMSGPPGTGKSQTITNMIAALMHAGKSVLFVSEKAAALDVVRNRLYGVGLGDFVLAMHSGDTTKKAVATELHRVLTTEVRATGAAGHELDRARQLREDLSAYSAAMNDPRQPLDRPLHDVLGRLTLLDQDGVPHVTLPVEGTRRIGDLSAAALTDLLTAAGGMSRAWRPAAEGESFVWRGLEGGAALPALDEASDALRALRAVAEERPFPASTREPFTPQELARMVTVLREGLPHRAPVTDAPLPRDVDAVLAQLADHLGAGKPGTAREAAVLLALTDLAGADHRPPPGWFDPVTLRRVREAVTEIRTALDSLEEARSAARRSFGEQALAAPDVGGLVERFAERGPLARFSAPYKADRQILTGLSADGAWHKSLVARLPDILAWQEAKAFADDATERHRDLLDRYGPEGTPGLSEADEALATADRALELASGFASRDTLADHLGADQVAPLPGLLAARARNALSDWCDAARERTERWTRATEQLLGLFDESRRLQLSAGMLGGLRTAEQLIGTLRSDPHGVEEWKAYRAGLAVLARYGIAGMVGSCVQQAVPAERFQSVVEQAVLRSWTEDVLDSDARLRITRAGELDIRVMDFQEADRRLVAAASGAVVEACNARRPRRFTGGAAAVITRQAELKRRHMPVRELLSRTKEVVRAIKPCFMMSPLTVSQLLPGDYDFDVVVFDEASQVRPADAVNCIYRGRALIVAGDEKQLPPTSFFDSTVEDDGDEYDEGAPDSFESLLHACKAGAMNELPLRWHYRSRHEDLITFSNRSFYQNSMVTFPGATDRGDDVGVALFTADGTYDRGGRRDNLLEAELVARRVIHHFDTRPGRSLGVVALSQAQASAIDLAVQQARLRRPDLDELFTDDRLGGFFVKNLESVQGDERDVMIMSIGYGPDEHGRIGMNFGPLNRDGGWRRLNVAVTRARYRMEVVSSFRSGSMSDSPNASVQHLKRYLDYAENGPAVLAHDVLQQEADTESPFEESVLRVLRGWGYDVQPQVGVAGFRIDLGLRHPDHPGRFAIGIECDGAMYHSSKAARDRDRLREEVLKGLGWQLHRIWGTDWYRGRTAAEQRLRDAVEGAVTAEPLPVQETPATLERTVPASVVIPAPPAPERVPVVTGTERSWSAPYRRAVVTVQPFCEIHLPEARTTLRTLLLKIVDGEGPIHEDLLVQRAREVWNVARAGSRIRDNVLHVLRMLSAEGLVTVRDGFANGAKDTNSRARTPGSEPPRKVNHVAPAERRLALRELAAECPGMSRDELVRQTAAYFGWKRLGPDIRGALATDIDVLRDAGALTESDGRLIVAP